MIENGVPVLVDFMNDKLIIAQVLSDFNTLDEENVSNAEKWIYIKNNLGTDKDVNIMHDFTSDDFQDAYTSPDPKIVNVYLFLAQLRYQIFEALIEYIGGGDDTKMLEIGRESSAVWAQKMYDKAVAVEAGEEVEHLWLN
jgi:hypothetical protein